MTVDELRQLLKTADPGAMVEIELECFDGRNRRAFDLSAGQYERRSGPVFIIEGDEPA